MRLYDKRWMERTTKNSYMCLCQTAHTVSAFSVNVGSVMKSLKWGERWGCAGLAVEACGSTSCHWAANDNMRNVSRESVSLSKCHLVSKRVRPTGAFQSSSLRENNRKSRQISQVLEELLLSLVTAHVEWQKLTILPLNVKKQTWFDLFKHMA